MKAKYKAVLRYIIADEITDLYGLAGLVSTWSKREAAVSDVPHYVLPATPEAYEKQVEAMSMICAAGMVAAYVKGQLGAQVCTDAREDYQLARAALSAIGIKRPTPSPGAPLRRQGDEGKTAS